MSSLLSLPPNSYMDSVESGFAIPELARNFLGHFSGEESGGGGEEMEVKKESKIDEILKNSKNNGLHVRVLGIPQSGAKSRVETQIKLCLQIVTSGGEKVTGWDYLSLPETLVSKEKLAKGRSIEVGENSKVIYLETKIVCASNPTKEVLSCFGCVQRERKRLMRKLEQANGSKDKKLLERQVTDDIEGDQKKILVFNCQPVVDFSRGDTILPSRITCYCRHHDEKVGFCIRFTLKDKDGHVVACGMSPPVLITDDHKSSKAKAKAKSSAKAIKANKRQRSGSDSPPREVIQAVPSASVGTSSVGSPDLSVKSETFEAMPSTVPAFDFAPSVSKIIPGSGPLHGGVECTILGADFTSGMTVMFGENEAFPTHCWGPNTLICLVPPAIIPGSVRVTIQGYLPAPESTPVMFTYKDDTDQALMELALQVVGLKMTGRLDDAKQIARQIVDQNTSDAQAQLSSWTSPSPTNSFRGVTPLGGNSRQEFESLIVNSIRGAARLDNSNELDLDLHNETSQHTLLHLACFKGHDSLAELLIELGADVNSQDRNGFTPLHYASWNGRDSLVRKLVSAGADTEVENSNYQTPVHFASSHSRSHDNIKALLGYEVSETESSDSCDEHNDVYMAGKNSNVSIPGVADGYLPRTRRRSTRNAADSSPDAKIDYEEVDRRFNKSKRRQHSAIYDVPLNPLSQCMPTHLDATSMYDCDDKLKVQRKRDRLLYNFWIPLCLVVVSFMAFSGHLAIPDMELKMPSFV